MQIYCTKYILYFSDSDISSDSSESDDDYSEALDNLDPLQLSNRKYRNNDDALYEESPSDEFYHEYSDEGQMLKIFLNIYYSMKYQYSSDDNLISLNYLDFYIYLSLTC